MNKAVCGFCLIIFVVKSRQQNLVSGNKSRSFHCLTENSDHGLIKCDLAADVFGPRLLVAGPHTLLPDASAL